MAPRARADAAADRGIGAVFLAFLGLGLTSFGGPVAHLGYFRDEFVTRRRWLDDAAYADLVAICQFLPGPTSSQVGIALGLNRAGYAGALAAWAGFTLPSAIALILLAVGLVHRADLLSPGLLHGLKIAAVVVVAQAVRSMAVALCPDRPRLLLMAAATCAALVLPSVPAQIAILVVAGLVGLAVPALRTTTPFAALSVPISDRAAIGWLALFLGLLIGLPVIAAVAPGRTIAVVDAFYRTGALVFGGGHVVLPLLQAEVVPTGWVAADTFVAGYGATQAMPGPLFAFAAFLGASMTAPPTGGFGGLLCLGAIFAPSFLLVFGVLPFRDRLGASAAARAVLAGVNAAVVGLLLAALYQPLWTTAILGPRDFALAVIGWVALVVVGLPPWLVVIGSGIAGAAITGLG